MPRLACACLLAAAAHAQDTQVGDWLFTLPEGMTIRTGIDGGPALGFRCTPDNYSTTAKFTFSADLQGNLWQSAFRDWAKEGREALRQSLAIGSQGETNESTTASGYRQISWIAPYTDQRHVDWVAILCCLRKGRRAGGIMLFTNDRQRLAQYAAGIDQLLGSATFASLRPKDDEPLQLKLQIDPRSTPSFLWDPPPALPQGDAGLEGIFGTTGLAAAPDPREWVTSAEFRWSYYTFFADGKVLRELPPEGLLSFRMDFWAPHFANDCGTYKVTGDRVELDFPRPGGRSLHETLRRDGDGLRSGDTVYERLAGDGVVLRGAFLRQDIDQLGEHYDKPITFAADGTFTDAGINSTMNVGWWCGGDYTLRDLNAIPGKGRWRVAANTLELLYEDGRRRRFAFHLYPGQESAAPRLIVLNGCMLARRD